MKKLYAVIGNPIAHSMSPLMHNDLFQHHGIDAHYHAFAIKEEDLADAVKGFRAMNISGFNVTVPHKVAIISLLDGVDPLARSIGAVNTVVNENGRLIGYNTDGSGYVKALKSELQGLNEKKVLMIGAGGAARAIYFTLAFEGVAHIDLTNRTPIKAERLVEECPYHAKSNIISLNEAEEQLAAYDIIIQTTSLGMSPNSECKVLSLHNLKESAFVSDIIYNPLETELLRQAKNKGAKTQNGIQMFVQQGALAFEKWTNVMPDIKRMTNRVLQQLGGTIC
ncbi:shikimate dehydrogenase [Robertmurraya sp. DFI.2.37]|uniref:shikimate dehydrogenase n=1 Tax=Robertmurraya sp. DFI.2.37 TaxID=3031819 RepID=UPI0012487480|nr:shikimate dehydrogenase [Robertmurraya sp. DFI.2.37]MDF1508280.1 shikimate dehydrogenase [Robertmurraya sp. DFI.2.37]